MLHRTITTLAMIGLLGAIANPTAIAAQKDSGSPSGIHDTSVKGGDSFKGSDSLKGPVKGSDVGKSGTPSGTPAKATKRAAPPKKVCKISSACVQAVKNACNKQCDSNSPVPTVSYTVGGALAGPNSPSLNNRCHDSCNSISAEGLSQCKSC